MKVQEGTPGSGDNTGCADRDAMRGYDARKRTVALRSTLLILGLSAVAATRSPILGLDLAVGGVCGVVNMLLIMRNAERLLDGRRSRGVYGMNNVVRVVGVGSLPALTAIATGPAWTLAVAYAGFFTPLWSYAMQLRNAYRRGT